ncbi:MAG TPA: ubiquinol oxidase subunit II [Candidatus Saccharimonadales bacterium]|nr:ubiquinol oxidase subunit II [Candidatus Saccharimonadales bacterium]
MNKKLKIILISGVVFVALVATAVASWYLSNHNVAVLNPKGIVAEDQRSLLIMSTLLMALVVVPVLIMAFGIAWRYRDGNKKAKYSPELAGSRIAESIWWLVPFAIIVVLAGLAYTSSHRLDPYRAITSDKKPLKVQVVALQWKWLFLYPEEHVASVNYLALPTDRPVEFTITADAPMNSFWIPQLGGQVYAMPGMSTKLHLQASQPGDYRGSSANLSGKGFAGMVFTAHATPQQEFDEWVATARNSANFMTLDTYNELAKPTTDVKPITYAFPASYDGLYDTVVMKYMTRLKSEGQ